MNRIELRERLGDAYDDFDGDKNSDGFGLIEAMIDNILGKEHVNNKEESKEDIKAWKSKG